jgi:hypothetical protein
MLMLLQSALTGGNKPEECMANTTVKLLEVKTKGKPVQFKLNVSSRNVHAFEFAQCIADDPDPVVAYVRSQWLSPPSRVKKSQVEDYLQAESGLRYKTDTRVVASCSSSNVLRGCAKYKRVKKSFEPTATDIALATCAKEVIVGKMDAFALGIPFVIDPLNGFLENDREVLLNPKEKWGSKKFVKRPEISRETMIEIKRLVR